MAVQSGWRMAALFLGRLWDCRTIVARAYFLQWRRTGGRFRPRGRLSSATGTAVGTAECACFWRAEGAAPSRTSSSIPTLCPSPLKTPHSTQMALSLLQNLLGQLLRIQRDSFVFLRLDSAVRLGTRLVRFACVWAAHLTHLLEWWIWAGHQACFDRGCGRADTAPWWYWYSVTSPCSWAGPTTNSPASTVALAMAWWQRQGITVTSQRLTADNRKALIFLLIPPRSCHSCSCPMRRGATPGNMWVFVNRVVCCGPTTLPMTKEITVWLGSKAHGGSYGAEAIDRDGIWCLIVQARGREGQAWVSHGQGVGHRLGWS